LPPAPHDFSELDFPSALQLFTLPENATGSKLSTEVSIVVPVYNEEENILPLTRQVSEAMKSYDFELVFVDDCSSDSTWQKIGEAHRLDKRVRGLRHARNCGQSAALWTGIQASHGDIIATLDGDLQNDPADLPRMLKELQTADFVSGTRTNRIDSRTRKVSSKVARWARRAVLKVDVCDSGCAIRVFKRSVLTSVFPFNGLHRFFPILAAGGGFKVLQVPVNHRARTAGVSKYGLGNRLWRGIYDLIAMAWFQKRRVPTVETTSIEETLNR
jgi:dolichol-phosphate mannosyltransferase